MDFRVLGPVEVWAGGRSVDTGSPQQRGVLAALLADAGRVVPVEVVIDRVWGQDPPVGARRALHAHIARIRGVLAGAKAPGGPLLTRRAGGYVLEADPELVDLLRFRRLVGRAREPGLDPADRVVLLTEAVALWRGDPLAGLAGQWAERARRSWRQEHQDAVIAWAQAQVQAGDAAAAVGPLTELAAECPLVEPVAAALIRALHAAGRSGAALEAYTAVRRRLAEELGADPGPDLRALQQAILRGHADTSAPTGPVAPAAPRAPAGGAAPPAASAPGGQPGPPPAAGPGRAIPAQLPAEVAAFTGRQTELAELDAILADGPGRGESAAVVISAVSGTAGVGKTTTG